MKQNRGFLLVLLCSERVSWLHSYEMWGDELLYSLSFLNSHWHVDRDVVYSYIGCNLKIPSCKKKYIYICCITYIANIAPQNCFMLIQIPPSPDSMESYFFTHQTLYSATSHSQAADPPLAYDHICERQLKLQRRRLFLRLLNIFC